MEQEFSKIFIGALESTPEGKKVLEEVGDVFRSSWDTMHEGNIYMLGFNPGGKGGEGCTVRESICKTEEKGWSDYYDERWGGKECGQHRHQLNVKKYLEKESLNLPIKSVPASNVLFVSGETVEKTKDRTLDLEPCWLVHKAALKIIKPKVILCLGNGEHRYKSAYAYIRSRVGMEYKDCSRCGNIKWFECSPRLLYEATADSPMILVIGVPHPSRFDPSSEMLGVVSNLYKERVG